jgi:hypothetical protein
MLVAIKSFPLKPSLSLLGQDCREVRKKSICFVSEGDMLMMPFLGLKEVIGLIILVFSHLFFSLNNP